jgi:uncharacterized repeat protein (TIGR03803 family)
MKNLSPTKTIAMILVLCAGTIAAQAQSYSTIATFDAANGADPVAPPIQAANGNFYGLTNTGGHGWGTLFEMTADGALTILHEFTGKKDGGNSYARLMQASTGNIYGTTAVGGANCVSANALCGTVFQLTSAGGVFTIYSFCAQTNSEGICLDGQFPYGPLVEAKGHFYGTTVTGGANNYGTVFEITSGGKLTTLYSFCSQKKCVDGASPYGGLVLATDGNLYGATTEGGNSGHGTIFAISLEGKFRRVYNFCSQANCADGGDPSGSLVQAANGNFYGVSVQGGTSTYCPISGAGCGTLFELTPKGVLTTLYNFCSQPNCADGYSPTAVMLGSDGNFYGTTTQAGANVYGGTMFEVTPTGEETTLYSFTPTDGGSQGLFQGANGDFYGTTAYGGGGGTNQCTPGGCGTVFSLSLP